MQVCSETKLYESNPQTIFSTLAAIIYSGRNPEHSLRRFAPKEPFYYADPAACLETLLYYWSRFQTGNCYKHFTSLFATSNTTAIG